MDVKAVGYTIFTKSNCSYCTKVKALLGTADDVHIINCDHIPRPELFKFLESKTEQTIRTYPMVFLNGKYIGGYDETKTFLEFDLNATF